MTIRNVFDLSGRAMSAQMTRLNTIASNIANAGSTFSKPEDDFQPFRPVFQTEFADKMPKAYVPCPKCTIVRIVMFMATGMFLMALMILQPTQAVLLASKLPSSTMIGLGIVVLGAIEFACRLWAHKSKKLDFSGKKAKRNGFFHRCKDIVINNDFQCRCFVCRAHKFLADKGE